MTQKLGLSLAATQCGASLGRGSNSPGDFDRRQPVRLRHVPLDAGGYDEGGAYWGWHVTGSLTARTVHRLYLIEGAAWDPCGCCKMFIRVPVPDYANSARACAVAKCRELGFIVKGRQS